ncbi:hypothetical protein ACFLV7_10675 [Chloroflexota bacterium]
MGIGDLYNGPSNTSFLFQTSQRRIASRANQAKPRATARYAAWRVLAVLFLI